jgi:DNA-directed RNA polymerase specialized sigma24 family protein
VIKSSSIGERLKTGAKPLTRSKADGSGAQERLPEIETEISRLLEAHWESLLVQLQISNQEAEGYVEEEALVFLLRAAAEAGDAEILNEASRILLTRCQKRISGYVRKFNVRLEDFDDCVSDVVSDLFIKLYDLSSNVCDFAQVRFWLFLKRFCFNSLSKYQLRQPFVDKTDSIDETNPETGQGLDIADEIKDFSPVDNEDLKKGLAVLPEPIRTAYILRVGEGWQIDSIEPGVPTLSKYFGKTEKTIRNWLLRAEDLLTEWQTEAAGINK